MPPSLTAWKVRCQTLLTEKAVSRLLFTLVAGYYSLLGAARSPANHNEGRRRKSVRRMRFRPRVCRKRNERSRASRSAVRTRRRDSRRYFVSPSPSTCARNRSAPAQLLSSSAEIPKRKSREKSLYVYGNFHVKCHESKQTKKQKNKKNTSSNGTHFVLLYIVKKFLTVYNCRVLVTLW